MPENTVQVFFPTANSQAKKRLGRLHKFFIGQRADLNSNIPGFDLPWSVRRCCRSPVVESVEDRIYPHILQ